MKVCNGFGLLHAIEYYKKKAITILKNSFIIDNWINKVLYSPGGIRYKIHKTSYQKLARDYKVSNAKKYIV